MARKPTKLTPQHKRILNYLMTHKSITPINAFDALGITKLSTRISEMKDLGYIFIQEMDESLNRYGEKCRFMRYWLKEGATING